jgi:hypothetical protein
MEYSNLNTVLGIMINARQVIRNDSDIDPSEVGIFANDRHYSIDWAISTICEELDRMEREE